MVTVVVTGVWDENSYIVASGNGNAVVVDPGGGFTQIRGHVAAQGLRVHAVLNTHAHHDHLGAAARVVEEYGVPFYLHPADEGLLQRANFYRKLFDGGEAISLPALDAPLSDGAVLEFGDLLIEVIHTPGHTPGSVCFRWETELFTGDTILAGRFGRTDLPGGDGHALRASINAIDERFPAETLVRPGHGRTLTLGEALADVSELGRAGS